MHTVNKNPKNKKLFKTKCWNMNDLTFQTCISSEGSEYQNQHLNIKLKENAIQK